MKILFLCEDVQIVNVDENECWWKTQCIDMILTALTLHKGVSECVR